MTHTVTGQVTQVLDADEVDEYAVGSTAELFAAHGWAVAVVVDQSERLSPGGYLQKWWPFTSPPNAHDVLVYEPHFDEGEHVALVCERLDDTWTCHPFNPLRDHRTLLERRYAQRVVDAAEGWNESMEETDDA